MKAFVAVIAAAITASSPCLAVPAGPGRADESLPSDAVNDFGINRFRKIKSKIIASTRTTRKANTTAIPTTVMVNPSNITKFSCHVGVGSVSNLNSTNIDGC